jgi:hypothetical protein
VAGAASDAGEMAAVVALPPGFGCDLTFLRVTHPRWITGTWVRYLHLYKNTQQNDRLLRPASQVRSFLRCVRGEDAAHPGGLGTCPPGSG